MVQAELREHDHVVECVAWCEGNTCATVNEALATDNRKPTYQGPFLISGSRDKTIKVRLASLTASFQNSINSYRYWFECF